MKKTFFSFFVTAMLAISCSDNDNPVPELPKAEGWPVIGYDLAFGIGILADTNFIRFTYNPDSTVKEERTYSLSGTDTTWWNISFYTYQEGKLVKVDVHNKNLPAPMVAYNYEYQNGRLFRRTHFGNQNIYDEMVYNETGKLVECNYHYLSEYVIQYKITWDGENVSKVETISIEDGVEKAGEISVFTYGSELNPRRFLYKDNYEWLTTSGLFELLSYNSPLKEEKWRNGKLWRRVIHEVKQNDRHQFESLLITDHTIIDGQVIGSGTLGKYIFQYAKP